MNLFADYIQPLTNWMQANPNWSLFFTFIISLTESLAIIGSIIPGSVTMTAIGILAGSGVMRIDLTLIAATLGAICGDSLSYALGYFYSEQLTEIWPFRKYPMWLKYGKEFFERHGGKSVLLGRFVGPLRSIIPVIAGIMHMKQLRFLIANTVSAIGWALLYVMPGVLIGAASHELSAENSTRLFILILLFLAAIWLVSLIIKWLVIRLNSYLRTSLHDAWINLKQYPILHKSVNLITPADEIYHYPTALFLLGTLLSFFLFILLLIFSIESQTIRMLNAPIHLFMQSFHTYYLNAFFILCTQLTSEITMSCIFIACAIWSIYHNKLRPLRYLISIVVVNVIVGYMLSKLIYSPRPTGLLVTMEGSSFPHITIQVATGFYGFILFYLNRQYTNFTNTLRSIVCIILGLSGIAAIYLGDYWVTDVLAAYCAGITICLVHCLIYRVSDTNHTESEASLTAISSPLVGALLLILLASASLSSYYQFKPMVYNHTAYHLEYTTNEQEWWNQENPILPLYLLNRIGQRISLLNIQYLGNLSALENNLRQQGWKTHKESFLSKVMSRISKQHHEVKLPLLNQLIDNKAPALIMTYTEKSTQSIIELNLWESNYYISELNKNIWIGNVHFVADSRLKKIDPSIDKPNSSDPLTHILTSLNHFITKRLEIPNARIKPTSIPADPFVLLIKENR